MPTAVWTRRSPMTKYCSSCHTPNRDRARYCRGCAGKFSGVPTPPTAFDSTRDLPFQSTLGGLPAAAPVAAIETPAVHAGEPSDRAAAPRDSMPGGAASWALLVALAGAVVLSSDGVPSARRTPATSHEAVPRRPAVAVDVGAATEGGTKTRAPVDVPHAPHPSDGTSILDALGIDPAKAAGGSAAEARSQAAPAAAATRDVPREQRNGPRKTAKAEENPTTTFWTEPSRPPGRTGDPTYQDAGPPVVAGPGPLRSPVRPPEVLRDSASPRQPDPGPPLAPGPGPRYDFSSPGALSR